MTSYRYRRTSIRCWHY